MNKKGDSPHAAYRESPGETAIRFCYSLDKNKEVVIISIVSLIFLCP